MTCRDGGKVFMCDHCPRGMYCLRFSSAAPIEHASLVLHAECHPTMNAAQVNRATLIVCGQHMCCQCSRSTSAAGGLLLRCQTCPQAFCTDCVDWDKITLVGDTIPEFVLRKYGKKDGAFFIRCTDCREQAEVDPEWAAGWESEIAESQRLVGLM